MRTLVSLLALASVVGCAQLAPLTQGGGLQTPTTPGAAPGGAGEPGGAAGAPGPAGEPASAPEAPKDAGPKTVSVSIRSACPKTVSVFYGDKPKFGSGTKSSVSSNSVSNKTFQPGDKVWVIDEKEEGLGSVTIAEGTRQVEIGADCRSIQAK